MSQIEEQHFVEIQPSVAVPVATDTFADLETTSVVSDVESTRSFASLSSFSSSRPSSPSVNLLGVSTLPPRSRLNTTAPSPAPVHVPYRRSISLTSPLASFAASRALRGTPLTISAPLASSFQHHRSPIPSPLDPPSFPFPTQNQLQSPPSSPRISIASEDSALRTPLGGRWELEEEVSEMTLVGRGRVVSNGSGRRATAGSIDRLPGIYESVGASGSSRNAMGRRTSGLSDAGRIGQGQSRRIAFSFCSRSLISLYSFFLSQTATNPSHLLPLKPTTLLLHLNTTRPRRPSSSVPTRAPSTNDSNLLPLPTTNPPPLPPPTLLLTSTLSNTGDTLRSGSTSSSSSNILASPRLPEEVEDTLLMSGGSRARVT